VPRPEGFRPGQPRWLELESTDPAGAQRFYGDLFGWTVSTAPPETGGHADFLLHGSPVAGVSPGVADRWLVYLSVDDAVATAEAAALHGAQSIVVDRAGDRGTSVLLDDPTGARAGGWQAGSHAGFGAMWEPGSPVWFEVVANDFGAASAFYTVVFDWTLETLSDTDEFRFSTFGSGPSAMTGIEDGSGRLGGGPSHWVVYFGVDDADAAVARALELGGTLRAAVEDTPFGRLAQLADPNGGAFRVMQEP
jgi:predicted enzyme related to lactoylglutathione lyase